MLYNWHVFRRLPFGFSILLNGFLWFIIKIDYLMNIRQSFPLHFGCVESLYFLNVATSFFQYIFTFLFKCFATFLYTSCIIIKTPFIGWIKLTIIITSLFWFLILGIKTIKLNLAVYQILRIRWILQL